MSAPDDKCEACGHKRAGMSLYGFGGKSGSLVYYLCPPCSRRISNDPDLSVSGFDAHIAEREYLHEVNKERDRLFSKIDILRMTAIDGMGLYLDAIEAAVEDIGEEWREKSGLHD